MPDSHFEKLPEAVQAHALDIAARMPDEYPFGYAVFLAEKAAEEAEKVA